MPINIVNKNSDSFDIILRTVNKAVDLIRPTYGPASNNVIISKVLNKMVVDDGVQIARDLEFDDPQENAVLSVIREVAIRTNDRVGDGTTSSLIMLQAIINEVAKVSRRDGRKICAELKKGLEEAKQQLLKMARPIKTFEELEKVARISFDDEKIAKIIAETWYKIGKDGVVTIDSSGTMETTAEITEGLTVHRGYMSPYMVNNPARMEAIVEKPYILLTDYRITEVADILPVMELLAKNNINSLVVVAENIESHAMGIINLNLAQGKFHLVAINAPSDDRAVFLEDLGIMTGAKVFSSSKGDRLQTVTMADLGRAKRFISRKESSVFVSPSGKKDAIKKAVDDLTIAVAAESRQKTKDELQKRIARFGNKVAVIKVGAATQNEERTLRYKVEDAVNAVQAAYKGGVVCGAGLSLARVETSSPILNEALKYPFQQLRDNMGIDFVPKLRDNEAINAVTNKVGEFMQIGVIDPVDVLIAGVESAVSISSILVRTSGMIVEQPKKPKIEE